jgi:hypothetical protein
MGLGPKESHLRTPDHGATGWGDLHRKLPTGGAAKGIPLKMCISPSLFIVPDIRPVSIFTVSIFAANLNDANATNNKQLKESNRIEVFIASFYFPVTITIPSGGSSR